VWTRPAGIPEGLSARVAVRLGPGGIVLSVQVARTSGNDAFDRSAVTAVRRADPLPMPDDPELAQPYREGIEMIFAPDT
jgi:colicin import membrane protein